MAAKRWVHVEMIIDGNSAVDLMEWSEGRVLADSLKFKPVKHGGETETGKLRPQMTGRDFILTFTEQTQKKSFPMAELQAAAAQFGLRRGSVYSAAANLVREKLLKRVEDGVYAPMRARTAPKKPTAKKTAAKPKRSSGLPVGGVGMPMLTLNAIRRLQNGSGEGVPLADIRKALGGKNISPYLTDLIKRQAVVRVGNASYRAVSAPLSAD